MVMPASRRSLQDHRLTAARARDAALRRLSVLNRLLAVGAVVLVLGFAALAVAATPPRHIAATAQVPHATSTATTPSTTKATTTHHRKRSDGITASSASGTSASSGASSTPSSSTSSSTQAVAPAPTVQPPVAVSGGS